MKHRLGIVLSGGGSRAFAHIGVLKALDEHGLGPDCIAGTSAGAIVGALYAAGYRAEEMLEFFIAKSPYRLSNVAVGKPGFIDGQKSFAGFLEYFPEDSFEALAKPLFVTATDIVNARSEIFSAGPLIYPILASCSLPMVFTPTEIDGRWYLDGGIVNNFPVEPIKKLCEILIGVYTSPLRQVEQSTLKTSLAISQRAIEVGMFFSSKRKFRQCDLVICPEELSRFGIFDGKNQRSILEIGYAAALEKIEAIRTLISP